MPRMDQIVSLAIEIYTSGPKSLDTTRERISVTRWSGGYSMREWSLDVLKLLPDDKEKALKIIKHHIPGGTEPEDRRRVGKLVGRYYRRVSERPDLLAAGGRFLKVME